MELSAFCREGKLKEALTLLQFMGKNRIPIKSYAYECLLQTCARAKALPQDSKGSKGLNKGIVIGIAIGAAFLVLAIIGIGAYALFLKKKTEAATKNSRPFGSWGFASSEYSGGAPQLKGARWFTFQELKQATNNFSTINEIGSGGGYGMVYKGILAESDRMVAMKRAKEESMQGGDEFKTEIELLSRVHHKNLVGLIGFCFEGGEHMLIYEYMPNGSLSDNLSVWNHEVMDIKKSIMQRSLRFHREAYEFRGEWISD